MTGTRVLINRRGELGHSGFFFKASECPGFWLTPPPYIEMNVSENRRRTSVLARPSELAGTTRRSGIRLLAAHASLSETVLYRNVVSVQGNDLRITSRPFTSHRAAINITAVIGIVVLRESLNPPRKNVSEQQSSQQQDDRNLSRPPERGYNRFDRNTASPGDATMLCFYRTLLVIIALTVPSIGRTDEKPAWPALEWKKAAPSPFARVESPAAVVDGKIYLFGGFTDDLEASNQVDVYDPASDSWTRKKDMPTRLTHLNPAIDGKTIWFAGGFKGKHPGPVTDEVWKYDIASDSLDRWTAAAGTACGGWPGGGRTQITLLRRLQSRSRHECRGSLEFVAGRGKEWQREADLPDPRGHVSAAVLDGKIYALGGDHGHDMTQIDVNSCHRFDPATKKWSAIASLPDGRSHFESSTIVHKGRILIVGGRCNSSKPPRNVVGDLLQYDPKADKWRVVGAMPEKLLAPAAAIISGRIVVTGGGLNNPRPLTAATRIAPLTDTD